MTYRFIGSACEIGGVGTLESFGQPIELSGETAKVAILGGAALLPEETFAGIGFTADELERYAYPGARISASGDFLVKFHLAHVKMAELRSEKESE